MAYVFREWRQFPVNYFLVVPCLADSQLHAGQFKFYGILNVIGWRGLRLAVVIRRGALSSNFRM